MDLAERVARLSPEQRAHLSTRLRALTGNGGPTPRTDGRLLAFVTADPEASLDVAELRRSLARFLPDYMIPSSVVVLDELPRGPNGKVDRKRLLASARRPPPTPSTRILTAAEESLLSIWRELLQREDIGVHDDFFELGGDSILSIQVIARARREGLRLTPTLIFQHPNIAELSRHALADGREAESAEDRTPESAPLTPIQTYWTRLESPNRSHWNMAFEVEVASSVSRSVLRRILGRILERHVALRLRFHESRAGWVQRCGPVDLDTCLEEHDLSGTAEDAQQDEVLRMAERLHPALDLRTGPVIRFALVGCGKERPHRLLVVAHHLVMDAVSWTILLDDLETGCRQAAEGRAIQVEPVPTSYLTWAARLKSAAMAGHFSDERGYWTSVTRPVAPLPVDSTDGDHTERSARSVSLVLGEDETASLFGEARRRYEASVEEVLCAALQTALTEWAGDCVTLDLEGHGREDILDGLDLSRTVGWFSSLFPVRLKKEPNQSPTEAVASMRTQLRAVPHRGIGYGALRHLSDSPLPVHDDPEVCFNYLGRIDAPLVSSRFLRRSAMGPGAWRCPECPRTHLLTINAWVDGDRFFIEWGYSENRHRRETIEEVARSFLRALRELLRGPPDDRAARPAGAGRTETPSGQVEDSYPLSPLQEGLLFHELYDPGPSVYWNQLFFTLEGPLDTARWQQAWQEVVDRHPILRTCFSWRGSEHPRQLVRPRAQIDVRREDWRTLPEPSHEERFAALLEQEAEQGADLSRAPLMRVTLVRCGEATHRCLWSQHHLLLDGWSGALVLKEVFERYEALRTGARIELPPPRPYRDYVAWLGEHGGHEHEQFWRRQLKGFGTPTPLKHGWITKAASPGRADQAHLEIRLPRALADGLERLAREKRLTLNTILQGAWALLLGVYSGESDVVFGTTVSVRPAEIPGVETMVGLFINTVPVRVRIPGEARLASWLRDLQSEMAELFEHAHSSLSDIHQWSEVTRPLSLFESLIVFENFPVSSVLSEPTADLRWTRFGSHELTSYPLALQVRPGRGLDLALSYDRHRFDERELRRTLRTLETLLEGIVADPERRISELPLLGPEERRRVLVEWNETAKETPRDLPVHELFEAQVERTPEALALESGGEELSYRELNRRANRLAHHLRRRGVGPESLVGICLDRGLEMVAAVLGVLKAGGAYVPLDPEYPARRLAFMLEDSGAPVLLTQSRLRESFPAEARAEVVCLDREEASIDEESAENPQSGVTTENLAYVIYTSGSTGEPKGVAIEHRSTSALIHWAKDAFSADELAGVLFSTSICFDLSVFELLAPLSWGGAVILVENALELHRSPAAERITLINTVPSAMTELLRRGPLPRSVRTVNLAGEPLTTALVKRIYEEPSVECVYDLFGPTEDTTYSTCALRTAEGPSTVGRPIANTRVYLLDRHLNPVPLGVPGEMYLGGEGLARGYLNRPELTRERFISDPFSGEPGARLYRTGDLARYLPSGDIEFLGRIDFQVKIRGFRIELGEIEARLAEHAGIAEAVVTARDDPLGHQRLVAFVTPSETGGAPSEELRGFLKASLPEYMVPSLIVTVESFPLTPSGKVDRRALSARAEHAETGSRRQAPGNRSEEQLTELWKDVLGLQELGVTDDFFEVGGHSLLAARLFTRMKEELGLDLPLATLFQAPTIRELVEACRRNVKVAAWDSLVPIQPDGLRPPLFCIHPAGGNVLIYRDLARRLGPDQPVYGLQARGLNGREPCLTRFEDMAAHYVAEIKKVQSTGPYHLCGYCLGGTIAYEMARQLEACGEKVASLSLFETYNIKAWTGSVSYWSRLRYSTQNVWFHVSSLRQLELREKARFTYEKSRVAFRRTIRTLFSALFHGVRKWEWGRETGITHARLARVNHEAHHRYVPGRYPGRVTLFRPKHDFGGVNDPGYGWTELAAGGVETHTLPVYPRVMLVEPFVELLAEELKPLLNQR